jgi:hypothetical protein
VILDDLGDPPDTPIALWVDRHGCPRAVAPHAPLKTFRPEPADVDPFVLTRVYAICRKTDHLLLYIGSTHQSLPTRLTLHIKSARIGKPGPFYRWLLTDPTRLDALEIIELAQYRGRAAGECAEYATIRALKSARVELHNSKTRYRPSDRCASLVLKP